MEEAQISGGEEIGDDFYEKIEAPKFVDLNAPDRHRTENDDRYWFCLRAGCDQNHGEEMDSEAIYKNFVLRVMAARSPNVRLRKALCRKETSPNKKCPQTVPAKTSKSRISRLAMVSSISQKLIDQKEKARPVLKQNATPNVKPKQPSTVAKALTTPRNQKRLSNPSVFRSVRNPKETTIEVPKTRVVAKALVFHSPKKTVKLKRSVELKKLCAGMKKLEITNGKNDTLDKPLRLDPSSKKLRGREVKSRVYDSLCSQNHKGLESKLLKCKKKKTEKDLKSGTGPASLEENECGLSDMEIEGRSLDVCATSGTSRNHERNEDEEHLTTKKSLEQPLDENKVRVSSDPTTSEEKKTESSGEGGAVNRGKSHEENIKPGLKVKEVTEKTVESDDKENDLTPNLKVNDMKEMEADDKENASASDANRKLNLRTSNLGKKNAVGNHGTTKGIGKVAKDSKENSTTAVNNAPVVKYTKPKPTNPKPFRLRTDERQILKEANLEKKHLQAAPLKDITTIARSHGGNPQKKRQNAVQKNEKFLGETEKANCTHQGNESKSETGTSKVQHAKKILSSRVSKGTVENKLPSTVRRCPISIHRKTKLVSSELENNKDKAVRRSEANLKRTTRSLSVKQLARPRGVASSRKKMVSILKPGQLGVTKETSPSNLKQKEGSKQNQSGDIVATKVQSSNALKPLPHGRRPATIPREPNFHNIHVPKSCTRRVG